MDLIKNKWKNYSSQKKLKEQWDDYRKVANNKTDKDTLNKFKTFLEHANPQIQHCLQNQDKIEDHLPDVQEILNTIFQFLNEYQEMTSMQNPDKLHLLNDVMDQSLLFAEFTLRDPRYRKNIKNQHNILAEFLNLMEKAQKVESKVIIVQLLMLFSQTVNQRIEFFEQQGFNRLLSIVMTRDPKLSQVISKALLHFLSIEDINTVDLDMEEVQSIKSRISTIAFQFRKYALTELQKIFIKQEVSQADEIKQTQNPMNQQIIEPNYQNIFQTDLNIQITFQDQDSSNKNYQEDDSTLDTPPGYQDQLNSESLLKEFQILHGGFKAILEMLFKASQDVQMNLMETITKILAHSEKTKIQFKRVNGYKVLTSFLIENSKLIEQSMNILENMVMNDCNEIGDYDAFTILLDLVIESESREIIEKILKQIESILMRNWKNILIARRLKINFYLGILSIRQLKYDIQEMVSNIGNQQIKNSLKNIINEKQIMNVENIQELINVVLNLICKFEGMYSLEIETIYSSFVLELIKRQNQEAFQQYLSLLWNIIENKEIKCIKINSFDHLTETLFENMFQIFEYCYQQFKSQEKTQFDYIAITKFLNLINQFLSCTHQCKIQESQEIIMNIVSQNKCEQFTLLVQQPINKILQSNPDLSLLFKLFDFEKQKCHATSVLNHQFNFALLEILVSLIQKYPQLSVSSNMLLYLSTSLYQYDPNPKLAAQIANIIFKTQKPSIYFTNLIHFLLSTQLDDQSTHFFESITKKEFISIDSITFIILLSKIVPKYTQYNSLYSQMLHTIEYTLNYFNHDDLEILFDSLFTSELLKKQANEQSHTFYSDVASILTIKAMLNHNHIIDKFLSHEYLSNAIGILESNNLVIKEQTIKLVICLYLINLKSKKNIVYTNKNKFFQLISKLIFDDQKFTNQFCNTIYKLIFWDLNDFHFQYPENTSQVSAIMCQSEEAQIIVKSQKQLLEQGNQQNIQNIEVLELFFLSLIKNDNQTYVVEIFKVFETLLTPNNINLLLDSNNFFQWLDNLYNANILNQLILQVFYKIIQFDFQKLQKQSKSVDQLKRNLITPSTLESWIEYFFNQIIENPLLKGDAPSFLKNLLYLIQNIDELIGYSEKINVLVLKSVNLIASKNTPNIRSILKSLGFFDLRDQLQIQVLRYNIEPENLTNIISGVSFSQIQGQKLFKESHCMAYLAKKLIQYQSYFGQVNRSIISFYRLQMLIIKILKYDLAQEDNQKYFAKILQNDQLIQFFYPQLQRKYVDMCCLMICFLDHLKVSDVLTRIKKKTKKLMKKLKIKVLLLRKNRKNSIFRILNFSSQGLIQQQKYLLLDFYGKDFLNIFYSEVFEDDRKQIALSLDKILIPVENEYKKYQSKINQKKYGRIQKLQDQNASETLQTQTSINEWQLKIQLRLKKSLERIKQKLTKIGEQSAEKLEQGEKEWFDICQI